VTKASPTEMEPRSLTSLLARDRADAEFLRGALVSPADCINVLGLDGKLLFMTEVGQRVMEVGDFKAIRGRSWLSFWQGQSQSDARAAVEAARAGGTGRFEGLTNTMAGTPKWWDVQVTPILGADGRPERLLSVSRDMTETHEARERIERALDAGTVVGTWVWDITTDRFTGDRRFARSCSLDADQLAAGLPLSKVVTAIHSDDLVRVEGSIAKATADSGRYSAEYRVRQIDGSWLWIEANGHCEVDAFGRAVRFPGVLVDIDRRKRHELRQQALLDLGDTLRGTTDLTEMDQAAAGTLGRVLNVSRAGYGHVDALQGVIIIDRDWCADAAVRSVAGRHRLREHVAYSDHLACGETVSVSDTETDPRTRSEIDKLRSLGVRALLNVPLIQDGKLVAMLFLNSTTERDWTDDEITFVRTVADRTWAAMQQARAEAELRRINETLEHQIAERTADRNRLWQLSGDLMLVASFDGVITAVNPAWTDKLGWHDEELIGCSFFELIHPDDRARTMAGARDIATCGRSFPRFENRYRHKDGSYRWVNWTAGPGAGFIIAVGRDSTDEKEQAIALRQTEDALRQSQKMEAVGHLTGGLAHDFNNLLTGITGSLELLQTRVLQGRLKDVDRYVNAAQSAAKRAAALTHRLLAFSRRQTLDPKPANVNRLVTDMEDLIRRIVGPEIAIETIAAGGLWTTRVDSSQLENALLNLCINARDAMPAGGKLTIETGNRWLDDRAAREREVPPGQYVSLCVSDNGTGMPPDVVARALDPFFTTKPIGQGTGLGLSMIFGFARQSGGQVRIYSKVGEGTMVCLYLPRHFGAAEEAESPVEPADAPQAGFDETVLVVDDEPTVRMLVTEMLEDLGYCAIEAADGAAGLKILDSERRIDLLVTDIGLPGGVNGRQLADAARVSRPDIKVLFITGYAESAVFCHEHLRPGMYVLTKPFAMEALAGRIKQLIDGS
jgi:PAS domain S-box-containing protein